MLVLGCYYDRRSPMFLWNFHTSPSFQQLTHNSYMAFAAGAFESFEHFLIAIATQVRCFRNSWKTSTRPLSAAASSDVKSHFLAICTILPLPSNFRGSSRWTLQAAYLRVLWPSLSVLSTQTPWFSDNQNNSAWPLSDAALRGVKTLFSAVDTRDMFLQLLENLHVSFFSFLSLSTLAPCRSSSQKTSM